MTTNVKAPRLLFHSMRAQDDFLTWKKEKKNLRKIATRAKKKILAIFWPEIEARHSIGKHTGLENQSRKSDDTKIENQI